jgi:GTPase SAR1 family protein
MGISDHKIGLDDILLFDPFTLSAKDRLKNLGVEITPDEFFESFYCKPFFLQRKRSKPNTGDELSHRLSDEEIKGLRAKKEKFEENLYNSSAIMWIMGYSGSGKSIYLNYLLHNIKDEREALIFNLEESSNIIMYAEIGFDIYSINKNNYNIATWFFAGQLMEKTYETITDILEKEDQETIAGIQKQYEELIKQEIGGNNTLFAVFKKIDNESKIETKRKIFNELKALMQGNSNGDDIRSIIQRILKVLTIFLFCYHRNSGINEKEKCKKIYFGI